MSRSPDIHKHFGSDVLVIDLDRLSYNIAEKLRGVCVATYMKFYHNLSMKFAFQDRT